MAKLSRDRGAGDNLHPRENLFISGVLSTINAEVITDCDGCSSFSLDLRGTFNLTIEVSGTSNGTDWLVIPVRPHLQPNTAYVSAITGSATGVWVGSCAPFYKIRARVTAYTSGSVNTVLNPSIGALDQSLCGLITPNTATNTAAISTALTLTIPAAGTNLKQYITFIRIVRFAGAVLTPAATPVVITTTNFPGGMAWSVPAEAAAQGTVYEIREQFDKALPLAVNSAATIVCPLTTGVIWRATAGWYVAP